jgi:membrane protease YdiL (CAAX protease family)
VSDGVERILAEVVDAGEPAASRGASAGAPRPLGFVNTLAWCVAAAAAGLLSALLFLVAAIAAERLSGTSIQPYETAIIGTAASVAELLFFAVIVVACRRSGWRATDYLGLSRPNGRYVRWSLLAFLLPEAVAIVIGQIGPLGGDIDPAIMLTETAVWFIVGGAIVAPVAEELLFRGFLHRGFAASRLGTVGAIVLTAVVWSGLHHDRTWLGSAELVFAGVAFGWLRWRSQSTIPTIAVHIVHNIASMLPIVLG